MASQTSKHPRTRSQVLESRAAKRSVKPGRRTSPGRAKTQSRQQSTQDADANTNVADGSSGAVVGVRNDHGDSLIEEYELERIVDMKKHGKGWKFKISWVGFDSDDDTWEPEENLDPETVAAFRAEKELASVGVGEAVPSTVDSSVGKRKRSSVVAKRSDLPNDDQGDCVAEPVAEGPSVSRPTRTSVGKQKARGSELVRDRNSGCESDSSSKPDESNDEVYELERIVDMKKDGEGWKFKISWVGFGSDDDTWEPEENLEPETVAAFRAHQEQASVGVHAAVASTRQRSQPAQRHADASGGGTAAKDADGDSVQVVLGTDVWHPSVCATCGDGPDGLASSCARCKKPMHHFCATDVCVSLNLKDSDGEAIVEFPNDVCYCSATCYTGLSVSRPSTNSPSKRKRASTRTVNNSSDSVYDDNSRSEDSEVSDQDSGQDSDLSAKRSKKKKKSPGTMAKQKKKVAPAREDDRGDHRWDTYSGSERPKEKKKKKPANKKKKNATPTRVDRDPLLGKMVAFCAEKEEWMPSTLYKASNGLYLSGRVHKPKHVVGERLAGKMYEVRWTVTNYTTAKFIHRITASKVQEGIQNYATISGGTLNNASWRHICQVPADEQWDVGESLDDYVILDGSSDLFNLQQPHPKNLAAIEELASLDFQPTRVMAEPVDLFKHEDGAIETKLRKEKGHLFSTASSSFFAYLPISFWRAVVSQSNDYAEGQKASAITLDEMVKFLGIMFYMTIVDKGEYTNYWGDQVEGAIFGEGDNSGKGLDSIMTLRRFKFIRKNLCFRHNVSSEELKKDPAARIRPLISMLKYTSPKYVHLGRNVAVDESSIACRSKFGRHLIVFNSSKPTGKFHFKIYACCCATTWLMVGFRLHCDSDMDDRLHDVVPVNEAEALKKRLKYSSAIRRTVLEVIRPLHGSRRVVNTDNFYTSVQLLLSLRDVGMYGRGTVRSTSAHFPRAHMFGKKSTEARGSSMQGVSSTAQVIAASWMDGNAVNIISNADGSGMGTVTRLIGKEKQSFPAPKCVAEYNKHMQGVDRLDQLRAKYSLADGHSMKKWHKKLALAFIDIARVNAFVTKRLRDSDVADKRLTRNEHRDFMVDLASEMISGKWKESVEDEGMLFADVLPTAVLPTESTASSPKAPTTPLTPPTVCEFQISSDVFPDATRGKRGCKVCLFEGRVKTMKTIYCRRHNICVCSQRYPVIPALAAIVCPYVDWDCWRKFHEYYLPRGLFNDQGRIKRSSTLHQARRKLTLADQEEKTEAGSTRSFVLSPYGGPGTSPFQARSSHFPLESGLSSNLPGSTPLTSTSPPTLVFSPFDGELANELAESSVDRHHSPTHPRSSPADSGSSYAVSPVQTVTPAFTVESSTSTDYPGSYDGEVARAHNADDRATLYNPEYPDEGAFPYI